MSAPDMESIIAAALAGHHKSSITGCDCGWAEIGKSHWDHRARAVFVAISEAGAVEWGIEIETPVGTARAKYGTKAEADSHCHGAVMPTKTVSRITGPWTAVEG